MSQYTNSIFYFIGTSSIKNDVVITEAKNITLHGLYQYPNIYCGSISVYNSSHIIISDISIRYFSVTICWSKNITITNSKFFGELDLDNEIATINLTNAFDVKLSSSVFTSSFVLTTYEPLLVCIKELLHYSLILINVNLTESQMELHIQQGTSYNVSTFFHHVDYSVSEYSPSLFLGESFFSFFIIKSSFCGFYIEFRDSVKSSNCILKYLGIQLTSTLVIEDSHFTHNPKGLEIRGHDMYLSQLSLPGPQTVNYHIIIKSCLIYDNQNVGLFIDGRFLRSTKIDIIGTNLIGIGGNKIINSLSNSISLDNVIVANSHSTGLILKTSIVTIKNNLIFKNNTGVVGGGLVINDSSQLTLSSSANLEFIDNHASYKGGGIYVEQATSSNMKLMIPNIPLTLINNSAGLVGGDMYGYYRSSRYNYQFNLTNPHISSASDATDICFCNPHVNNTHGNIFECSTTYFTHISPGQAIEFNVVLFGYDYFGSLTVTDGIVEIYKSKPSNNLKPANQTYVPTTCSVIEYTPNVIHKKHVSYILIYTRPFIGSLKVYFTFNECPIGFNTSNSSNICTCSRSVSRENVTCDINSLTITHNGLLWIGTYDKSTPFNANATNPNACIINEECLLYCSPNPVTFMLNKTDTQCVDNRGQRMCGSCREGYSILMGSNKCGHCHNNYMMIAWIALFAVMGVLIVVLLIALNLTVSVGTLNGLLFYANIVKLYEPVFSRKGSLPVLSQVISWINLDFGFEICFYNGMDSYVKQWLQFAFPLYLWIIIIIIILLCKRYGKISRLMGSHAVPVLSTLFLLSYTKLVRTIVIVLHKREVILHCTNESVRSVNLWYEDPNVEYAKGKHAGLFGFALLVSVFFVIPYTLFLLLNPFYEKYLSNFKIFKKFSSRFKPIIDAYSGPMKDEYRFWPGLLLVARIPVLLSVTLVDSFIESQHFLLSILLTVLVIVLSLSNCFGGVYMKNINNVLEVWFLFNLCIMVGLSVALNEDSKVFIWYNTCLSVFIFNFILIVIYHLYVQLSHMKCYDALIKKLFKKQDDDEPLLNEFESEKTVDQQRKEIVPSSTDYFRRQDSVIDLYQS